MRVKDLKVGQKVWFSTNRNKLMKGEGEQVTIHAMGRYTRAWEPCGALITPTSAPGPQMTVLKFTIAKDDRSRRDWLMKFGKESSAQVFYLVEGGRHLMHEDEHKVMRDAAADRKLELAAHKQRGEALVEQAQTLARKALIDAGMPAELFTVFFNTSQRWDPKTKRWAWKPMIDVQINDDKVEQLVKSRELDQVFRDHAAWKALPVPGKDCVL